MYRKNSGIKLICGKGSGTTEKHIVISNVKTARLFFEFPKEKVRLK
jgi:hypothetical protein